MGKIKEHFKKHKAVYISSGISLVTGVAFGVAARGTQIVLNDSVKVQIASPTTNNIMLEMTRPGPKSFVVQSLSDQRVWPSLRAAARDLNVHPSVVSAHLKGLKDSVDGIKLTKITEV